MKVTHYFLHYTYGTMAKNILQEYFEEYIKSLNGRMVKEFEINQLLKSIEEQVKKLNIKFKRCRELEIRFHHHDGIIHLHGTHLNFSIRPASLVSVTELKTVEL